MSISRRLLFVDEFDWEYGNLKKANVIKTIKSLDYEIEASISYLIVVDIGKQWPGDVFKLFKDKGMGWDSVYMQNDNEARLMWVDIDHWEPTKEVEEVDEFRKELLQKQFQLAPKEKEGLKKKQEELDGLFAELQRSILFKKFVKPACFGNYGYGNTCNQYPCQYEDECRPGGEW